MWWIDVTRIDGLYVARFRGGQHEGCGHSIPSALRDLRTKEGFWESAWVCVRGQRVFLDERIGEFAEHLKERRRIP